MDDHRKLERALDLLRAADMLVLATAGPDGPHTSLMACAADAQGREVALAMDAGSRKWTNLAAEPRVSLLVDDRQRHEERGNVSALTVSGRVVPPDQGEGDHRAVERLLAKHPHLSVFLDAPSGRVVRVRGQRILLLSGPTEAWSYSFDD